MLAAIKVIDLSIIPKLKMIAETSLIELAFIIRAQPKAIAVLEAVIIAVVMITICATIITIKLKTRKGSILQMKNQMIYQMKKMKKMVKEQKSEIQCVPDVNITA
jgi:hypothetical protein